MRKVERQSHLRQLINSNNIERQEDFVRLLEAKNIEVTQATISRDIKEMQLIKVPTDGGGYHYSFPVKKQMDSEKKMRRTLKDAFISMKAQDNMVVINVHPGNGPALSSLISQSNDENLFATLGDDSTVLNVCISKAATQDFMNKMNDFLED